MRADLQLAQELGSAHMDLPRRKDAAGLGNASHVLSTTHAVLPELAAGVPRPPGEHFIEASSYSTYLEFPKMQLSAF